MDGFCCAVDSVCGFCESIVEVIEAWAFGIGVEYYSWNGDSVHIVTGSDTVWFWFVRSQGIDDPVWSHGLVTLPHTGDRPAAGVRG